MQTNISSAFAGSTLHSLFSLGQLDDTIMKKLIAPKGINDAEHKERIKKHLEEKFETVGNSKYLVLANMKVLIIDEATLLCHGMLLFVHFLCQLLKSKDQAFGGIQVSVRSR